MIATLESFHESLDVVFTVNLDRETIDWCSPCISAMKGSDELHSIVQEKCTSLDDVSTLGKLLASVWNEIYLMYWVECYDFQGDR